MIFVMRIRIKMEPVHMVFLETSKAQAELNLQTKGLTYLLILEVGYFFFFFFLSAFSFFLPDSDYFYIFLSNYNITIAVYALNTVCFKIENGTSLSVKNLIFRYYVSIRKMYTTGINF